MDRKETANKLMEVEWRMSELVGVCEDDRHLFAETKEAFVGEFEWEDMQTISGERALHLYDIVVSREKTRAFLGILDRERRYVEDNLAELIDIVLECRSAVNESLESHGEDEQ